MLFRSRDGASLTCSFCGKAQKEVKKLIAGPTVYICDECIGLCNDIIAEEVEKDEPYTGSAPRSFSTSKPTTRTASLSSGPRLPTTSSRKCDGSDSAPSRSTASDFC